MFEVTEQFQSSGVIRACLQSLDERIKTFTFFFEVKDDVKVKQTAGVSMNHITEANEKLRKIQGLFEVISRNIYNKNDIDKELTDQTIEAKKTQKWLSIIKMILVAGMCAGQVYFITLFFTTGSKRMMQG